MVQFDEDFQNEVKQDSHYVAIGDIFKNIAQILKYAIFRNFVDDLVCMRYPRKTKVGFCNIFVA